MAIEKGNWWIEIRRKYLNCSPQKWLGLINHTVEVEVQPHGNRRVGLQIFLWVLSLSVVQAWIPRICNHVYNSRSASRAKLHTSRFLGKNFKKPGYSIESKEVLVGHLFRSYEFKEQFNKIFFFFLAINNVDKRQKVTFICLKSNNTKMISVFLHNPSSICKNWRIDVWRINWRKKIIEDKKWRFVRICSEKDNLAKLLLFENYSHSSSTLSSKNNKAS